MPQRTQPSRSQPTATQRRRRRPAEEEDEGGVDMSQDAMDVEDGDIEDEDGVTELTRRANDLARLALFSEHRRAALRRDEINKKVLGSNTRIFNVVFEKAQEILRRTFGMELVELHKGTEAEEGDKQTETGLKKKTASTGTKAYILRSTLHPAIIERASLSDASIIEEESADMPDDDLADEEGFPRMHGSLLAWSSSDQLAATGILYVILALVLVHGRVISDSELRSHLKRLRLSPNATIPTSATATQRSLTVDAYLKELDRQQYLARQQVGGGKAGAGKRARGGGASQNPRGGEGGADETQYEWRWGPRAAAEVGEQAIARFVGEFMVERNRGPEVDESEEEEENNGHQGGRARRERERARQQDANTKLEKVMKGIERSAGGTLQDVR